MVSDDGCGCSSLNSEVKEGKRNFCARGALRGGWTAPLSRMAEDATAAEAKDEHSLSLY